MASFLLSLPAQAGSYAFAGSIVAHGAALIVGLRMASTLAGGPVGPVPVQEPLVDVDVIQVAPPEVVPPPPLPDVTEPHVRVIPLRAPQPPVYANTPVAPRAPPVSDAPPPPASVEAAPALTADEGTPHFTLPAGGGSGPTFGAVSAAGTPRVEVKVDDTPVPEQGVSTPARLAHGGAPPYPFGARSDHVEGDVVLELVVSTAGAVDSVRAVRGPGHGLDEAAVAAMRDYRFSPAQKDGHAVRVRMHWTMQFRLPP